MDPLSVTASIIAVLQLSSQVVLHICTAVGANDARQRLRNELRACDDILQQLKDEVDDSEEGKAWKEKVQALAASDAPISRLNAALRAVELKLQLRPA